LGEARNLISAEDTESVSFDTQNENINQIHPASANRRKSIWRYIQIGICLIVLVGIVAIALQIDPIGVANVPGAEEKCMYWDGNRYVPVECGNKAVSPTTIPLDINVLKGFKRISWPDTLTKNSIGEVWYARRAGEYEFFTDSTMHPVDTQRRLKPLTQYILSNHISYHRFILDVLVATLSLILLLLALFYIARKVIGSSRFQFKPEE
jgi:NADH:ubiquinone oxidoreductase subunit 3 (subunit A)